MGSRSHRPLGIAVGIMVVTLVLALVLVSSVFSPSTATQSRSLPGSGGIGHPSATGRVVSLTAEPASLTISIVAVNSSTRSGDVTIEAIPVNAVAVSQIYFYVDSTFEGTDLAAPYCLGGSSEGVCRPFDTTTLSSGPHTVKAFMSYNQGSLQADALLTVTNWLPSPTPSTTLPKTTMPRPSTTTTEAPPARTPTTTGGRGTPSAPFVGLNVYELASDPGVNLGCGTSFAGQWATFFSSLPSGTVVRFWATQQMATNAADPQQPDWAALDSVFDTAAQYHVQLIPVLGNEWTNCDGVQAVQKQLSWFEGGYTSNNDQGPLSYSQWVRAIVARYASSPAIYAWEPMNEAQARNGDGSCTESAAAQALRSFYDAVGGTIHSIDRGRKVESGLLGEGNCGTANGDYAYVGASSGIDVLSYHDYYPPNESEGGDLWNGIAVRISQAAVLRKPILAGEDGIAAGSGCSESLSRRQTDFASRVQAQGAAGVVGMLLWNWEQAPSNCSYDIGPGDPSLALLRASTP